MLKLWNEDNFIFEKNTEVRWALYRVNFCQQKFADDEYFFHKEYSDFSHIFLANVQHKNCFPGYVELYHSSEFFFLKIFKETGMLWQYSSTGIGLHLIDNSTRYPLRDYCCIFDTRIVSSCTPISQYLSSLVQVCYSRIDH